MKSEKSNPPNARPTLGQVAEAVAGAMLAGEDIDALGHAIARDDEGRPIYLVAVIMGPQNIAGVAKALEKIKPKLAKVPEIAREDDSRVG